jgi:drug/metabolite transporter (DMT)-like permease
MDSANPKALVALVFTVLVWGLAPALVRGFSLAAGPWDSMFIRLISVAIICTALLPFSGWRIARKDWWRIVVVSCVGIFGYFVGSIFGFSYIGAGPGGLIFATQPLIIAVLASVIGLERLTPSVIVGFAVSFAGTLFLLGDSLSMTGSNPILGAVFIFGACLTFGINVVLSKPLAQTYGAFRLTNVTMVLAAVPALLFFRPEAWTIMKGLDWKAWASLVYLGPIGTILAVVTWNFAVARLRPSTVGGSMYVVPVLALIAGVVMLGEPLTVRGLAAGAIIIAGVAIAEFWGRSSPAAFNSERESNA